jgi:AraC-like DNA-binding protein
MSNPTDNTFFPPNIPGEKMVNSLTDYKRKKFAAMPCTRELMITAAGYHPRAEGHYCKRPRGSRGYVFLYCIEGSGWVRYDDQDILITRNQGVFLRPEWAHEYGASKMHPWSYYYIHYEGALAADYTRMLLDGMECGTCWLKETDEYLKCFSMILGNLEKGWIYPNMVMASANLHKLLAWIYLKKQHDAAGVERVSTEARVQAVADMVEENPQNNISVLEMARAANLSNSRFRELFKALIGMSPKQFCLHVQIEKAKQLLTSSQLCVHEISECVGTPDSHYFSRIFSRKVGVSPSEYRETCKGS